MARSGATSHSGGMVKGMATKKYTVTLPEGSMTLIEAYHSKIRRPVWNWTVSGIVVEPVTRAVADEAIGLLRETGLHGHKYPIDATLAVLANRRPGRVAVFTSDEDDMGRLCAARVLVRGL